MKKIKYCVSAVSVVFFALVVPVGCDDGGSGDNGELDAYFDSHPYVSDPRDGGDTLVTLTPPSATLSTVGEKAVFKFNGGSGPITWDVSDSSKGSVSASGDQGVYTVTAVGRNDVIAYDRNGRAAIAKINGATTGSGSPLSAGASPGQLNNNNDMTVIAATGGTGPYSWSVSDASKGNFVNGTTGASVLYIRNSSGDNGITVTDSLGATANIVIKQP